ncbi:hypothetical protein OPV22_014535 [Ensete ventricosum]|uniref:Uncharacterized protein n=1 Tax=Ensete ventricosum TaxID=4639 RepID=A0AAV8PQE7_ENSVE|nr:hypothetical protein OPV22_014535 [Ensete ventricosum]
MGHTWRLRLLIRNAAGSHILRPQERWRRKGRTDDADRVSPSRIPNRRMRDTKGTRRLFASLLRSSFDSNYSMRRRFS